ncbi:stage V sporulation protein K [Streptococcus mitis]|uniref:Stage V sporulation protein K n=1 Tax=Streptococcus mitis TaxID=28037 RepID=A0A1X1L771_STRMT|nr:AAA family ATPase [Streptococcus mitis]ORP07563.1 stage V sporulation protein K [Streptococcus mitis]
MNYYQVEFKNHDDFLKTQTEDFINTNRLLLFKEDDAYYLISQENYNDQEIMGKIKDFFDHEFTLKKVKTLTESDFIKKLETSDRRELVKFLLSANKETIPHYLKPNFEKLDELKNIYGLTDFKKAVQELITYLSFQEKINNNEQQQHFYIFIGEKGSGRKFAIKFLESLFGMNAIFVNCNQYFVPKIGEKDFSVLVDYLSARLKTKSDIFDNFRQKKGNSFNIIISRSIQEAESIRKELLEDFNKVSIINFPQYDESELKGIGLQMLNQKSVQLSNEDFEDLFENKVLKDAKEVRLFVQELIEFAVQNNYDPSDKYELNLDGFIIKNESSVEDEETAEKKLSELIGLEEVKIVLNQQLAYNRVSALRQAHGFSNQVLNRHLVFSGNPGTGKTVVARLFSEILYNNKIIQKNKLVEVGRTELVGEYVGQTAPKVKRAFDDAKGGVLFIDEAYSLIQSSERDFGHEAISAIIQEMENRRDEVLVIFAGYEELMAQFIETNPGLSSRISREIKFFDYTVNQLIAILELMINKRHYQLIDDCKIVLHQHFSEVVNCSYFGNARYVRKLVDEIVFSQAQRVIEGDKIQLEDENFLNQITLTDINKAIVAIEAKLSKSISLIGFGR